MRSPRPTKLVTLPLSVTPVKVQAVPWAMLAPRWWLSWLGLGVIRLLMFLPVTWLQALGRAAGGLVYRLVKSRRHIVRVNLRLCFPDLDEASVETLVRGHFEAIGMGVFEALMIWLTPDGKLAPFINVEGIEHLDAALAGGHGVLLLTGHFTTLEMAAYLGRPQHAMYRPIDNPFLDFWVRRWRESITLRPALPKDDLRALIRCLRDGGAVWYAPDQTLEVAGAEFVPFFGVPTLTLTATSRLAQMGRARVVPFFVERHHDRYRIVVQPPLENFPSGDDFADTARVNGVIEDAIRRCPEQYFWSHRRFKHRPPGTPDVYAR